MVECTKHTSVLRFGYIQSLSRSIGLVGSGRIVASTAIQQDVCHWDVHVLFYLPLLMDNMLVSFPEEQVESVICIVMAGRAD
jgi:hypothetical protein